MTRKNEKLPLEFLFKKFISDSKIGKRLQKNGTLISNAVIENYQVVLKNITGFCEHSKNEWCFNINYKASLANFKKEKPHYSRFYKQYTNYLYEKSCGDIYVGFNIKIIKTLFNYLITKKGYEMGMFYKDFYSPREVIPIIVVNQEQFKFLITDKIFEAGLSAKSKLVKDIFVVGCSIGLRVSDLMALQPKNMEKVGDTLYIVTKSSKTNTYTRIKIPGYVKDILNQYRGKQKTLVPYFSLDNFNHHLKLLGELAGWTYEVGKIRSKRGIRKEQRKPNGNLYRFCDLLSSHVMRRTAITTMLILGMPEPLVRKISGHAHNSQEFYKYVNYSESFTDSQTDMVFERLLD